MLCDSLFCLSHHVLPHSLLNKLPTRVYIFQSCSLTNQQKLNRPNPGLSSVSWLHLDSKHCHTEPTPSNPGIWSRDQTQRTTVGISPSFLPARRWANLKAKENRRNGPRTLCLCRIIFLSALFSDALHTQCPSHPLSTPVFALSFHLPSDHLPPSSQMMPPLHLDKAFYIEMSSTAFLFEECVNSLKSLEW